MSEFWIIIIIETLITIILGTLLHFTYKWSGYNKFIATFAAVNESVWEHIKLVLSGLFFCIFIDIWSVGGYPNYWLARSVSFLVPVILIPALFYGYRALLKRKSFLPLDILIFILSCFSASFVFSLLLGTSPLGALDSVASLVISLLILVSYLLFTRFPLQRGLFKDPVTGKYGLAATPRPKSSKKSKTKKPSRFRVLIIILLALASFTTGAVLLSALIHPPVAEEPTVAEVEPEPEPDPIPVPKTTGPLVCPDTIPAAECDLAANYHVDSTLPRLLSIPSVGIFSRVNVVGKVNGAVGTPADLRMTAWYNRSSLPGVYNGVAFLNAHGGNDGNGNVIGNGIFNNLVYVQPGDEIYIEMGDEVTRYVYRVTEVLWKDKYTEANPYMTTALSPVPSGDPTLTLVTCAGRWIANEKTFSHRVFVRAVMEYE